MERLPRQFWRQHCYRRDSRVIAQTLKTFELRISNASRARPTTTSGPTTWARSGTISGHHGVMEATNQAPDLRRL